MGFGNIQKSKSSAETSNDASTKTFDERIAAADQAQAFRAGGDLNTGIAVTGGGQESVTSVSVESGDLNFLRDVAAGIATLTEDVLSRNNELATDAMLKVSDVKSTGLTEGATQLQKTVLIGLVIGVLAIFALGLFKR
jgi:hypothetical protein